MGFNAAGVLAVFEVVIRPHLLLPKIIIKGPYPMPLVHHRPIPLTVEKKPADIRELDVSKLQASGISGVVIDKDNCLVGSSPSITSSHLSTITADHAKIRHSRQRPAGADMT